MLHSRQAFPFLCNSSCRALMFRSSPPQVNQLSRHSLIECTYCHYHCCAVLISITEPTAVLHSLRCSRSSVHCSNSYVQSLCNSALVSCCRPPQVESVRLRQLNVCALGGCAFRPIPAILVMLGMLLAVLLFSVHFMHSYAWPLFPAHLCTFLSFLLLSCTISNVRSFHATLPCLANSGVGCLHVATCDGLWRPLEMSLACMPLSWTGLGIMGDTCKRAGHDGTCMQMIWTGAGHAWGRLETHRETMQYM